jgi:hypothetical protein
MNLFLSAIFGIIGGLFFVYGFTLDHTGSAVRQIVTLMYQIIGVLFLIVASVFYIGDK